jgi:alkylation response protein AidB-like acyl-CoA dehydrogenase
MRYQAFRTLGGDDPVAASVSKLLWGPWHRRRLGELAVDVVGAEATLAGSPYKLGYEQPLLLSTCSDTTYAGSDEIQRNIVSQRMLGLPRS